ncbi:bifunctional enoyl-CoA hydratase/phosphate acetyltransferase [Pseudoduganella buxea]|uniref:Bifunctional enoyl-CoA hydratase/phosphate acetyltransferase n=1 Tax=Pseudoduganella buxea TaxID=1949069 RepID=A0A6I3SXK6_9BURK|nr:bifunctional enoyl-CoA hydratase/phosphate acetyltransferase [Pseudoduganella buxea]MTV52992.1 bifunctional enoyl-CoA hydratase/phosphate acetyltransferase [Pseudoduganella buxea]GGC08936.1 bifunctional enoyl-CoA hydratase/phosphate acetyltransferase [Pseudoduganella buxea]
MTASSPDPARTIRNRTFDEIIIGECASIERTLTPEDILLFAVMSGDLNPQHLDAQFAAATRFHGVIAHGMWGGALISAVLGTRLPGPGTVYLKQTLKFRAPVRVGDTLLIKVTVVSRDENRKLLTLDCMCTNQNDITVIEGVATVLAPTERIERPSATLPEVRLSAGGGLEQLLDRVRPLGPIKMAVVHPCDAPSLTAVFDARAAGLIEPLLVAPRARLQAMAMQAGLDLSDLEIEDVPHSHAAAARAADLAAEGRVDALMQGSLHVDELLHAILKAGPGLRTKRRLSHCFLMHTPTYPRPFIITDAVVNVAPTLEDKADIVQNAIDLAHAIGVPEPRVAILAAVETINPAMQATLDAAALCKMAERGQIVGALLDGPLAFDNAVSIAAARVKGITSPVAGHADVLIVPDLEAGNMLAKQLECMGNAASAGVVLGAKVPVVLAATPHSRTSRTGSCAIATMLAHHYRAFPP